MTSKDKLIDLIRRLDGKGYREYKKLAGAYDFGQFCLFIDHVQGDPFASPSACRIQISHDTAKFPLNCFNNKSRKIAFCDFLTRSFSAGIRSISKGVRGSGNSGKIAIDIPGQEVLETCAVVALPEYIEVRFTIGFPAEGRRIKSRELISILYNSLPSLVENNLLYSALNFKTLNLYINTSEDADALRNQLEKEGLVSFIANGSILPRASGVDPKPLKEKSVVPFKAPESLTVTLNRPNQGPISGLGIRKGITLITGGGFHGKSTLLNAIELGIYNHIPGDGREFVVSSPTAFKVRSEDGRPITGTNISYFINQLPFQKDTTRFFTTNASGSTSQAANIIEAYEAGTNCLLIDEDTSATNFMIRDRRMQQLINKENEPITPFLDRIKDLSERENVSTIMVMGGCGDYLDVADHVLMMSSYKVEDKTFEAKKIVASTPNFRNEEGDTPFERIRQRYPSVAEQEMFKGHKRLPIKAQGINTIKFGKTVIDLSYIEQLVHSSQTRTIAVLLNEILPQLKGNISFNDILQMIEDKFEICGICGLGNGKDGYLAQVRKLDIAATINRIRILKMR